VATEKNSVRPSPPEKVALAIEHFISVGENAVVLLDGFEYLIAHNDFSSVLALLHDLNEIVALHDGILLVPMDPTAFQEREFAMIRREAGLLGPLAPEYVEVSHVTA
jgi:archaellum biogenesis ATPase FlaH